VNVQRLTDFAQAVFGGLSPRLARKPLHGAMLGSLALYRTALDVAAVSQNKPPHTLQVDLTVGEGPQG